MGSKEELLREENVILDKKIAVIKNEINLENRIIGDYYIEDVGNRKEYLEAIERKNNYLKMIENPYFGRVDIIYDDDEKESIYIGIKPLIVDNIAHIISWASPIANVYENFDGGDFKYEHVDKNGKILLLKGVITDKRKITIEKSKVKDVYQYSNIQSKEIDFKEEDYIKDKIINAETDKLGIIVETIQRDQNEIIRLPIERNVLVQGCAGSGKSSVAFHRLAYLAYNYELDSDELLVISPNKIFQGYTSHILMELGAKFNVKQYTFNEFIKLNTGIDIKSVKKGLDSKENNELNQIKTSKFFKELLDKYVKSFEENYIPKENIKIDEFILIDYEEINSIWLKTFTTDKFNNKVEKFKDYIERYLRDKCSEYIMELKKQYENNDKVIREYYTNPIIYNEIRKLSKDEEDIRIKRLQKQFTMVINGYINKLKIIDVEGLYKKFIKDFDKIVSSEYEFYTEIDKNLLFKNIKLEYINNIDYIAISYLYYKFNNNDNKYRHIVIDECQDLSYIEVAILEELTKSFTLVGDFNQQVSLNKSTVTVEEINYIFKNHTYFQTYFLNKSFRNSKSINNYCNEILRPYFKSEDFIPKAFNRDTKKPIVYLNMTDNQTINEIIDNINKRSSYNKNIAVIFKDEINARNCYKIIVEKNIGIDINLIDNEECKYKKGVTIISAKLSKGLEFDYVIIADGHRYNSTEEDRRLLYIAATRALHELDIYTQIKDCYLTSINDKLWSGKSKFSTEGITSDLKLSIINNLQSSYLYLPDEYKEYIYSISDDLKLIDLWMKLKGSDDIDGVFYNEGVKIKLLENEEYSNDKNKSDIIENISNTVVIREEKKDLLLGDGCKEIIKDIEKLKRNLSYTQMLTAEYIMNNLPSILKFKTATELANEIGVSASTVSSTLLRLRQGNFCKFRKKIRECIKEDNCV